MVRHRRLAFGAALSLLLCLATVALWIRSASFKEDLGYNRYGRPVRGWSAFVCDSVYSHDGELDFVHSLMLRAPHFHDQLRVGLIHHGNSGLYQVNDSYYSHVIEPSGVTGVSWGGIKEFNGKTDYRAEGLRIPMWPILLCFAILPGRWIFLTLRARSRAKAGLCRECGYDLRATHDRCPECGAELKANI